MFLNIKAVVNKNCALYYESVLRGFLASLEIICNLTGIMRIGINFASSSWLNGACISLLKMQSKKKAFVNVARESTLKRLATFIFFPFKMHWETWIHCYVHAYWESILVIIFYLSHVVKVWRRFGFEQSHPLSR